MTENIITKLYLLELIKPYSKQEAFNNYEKFGDLLKRELKSYKIVVRDRKGFTDLIYRYNELYLKDEEFDNHFNMLVRATAIYLTRLRLEEVNNEK